MIHFHSVTLQSLFSLSVNIFVFSHFLQLTIIASWYLKITKLLLNIFFVLDPGYPGVNLDDPYSDIPFAVVLDCFSVMNLIFAII